MVDNQREQSLVNIIARARERAKADLASHQTQDARIFLDEARKNLDDLLTLREQPHIITQAGTRINPSLYDNEDQLVGQVVYNSFMALGKDKGKTDPAARLQQVEANFTLAEAYVAMGVKVNNAKKRYRTVIGYGERTFAELKKDNLQKIPMIRLAYKIGTSYKRLLDIELHILMTVEKSIEVLVKDPDSHRPDVVDHELPYGHLPLDTKGRIPEFKFRARLSSRHPYLTKAREWLSVMQDINHTAQITNIAELGFSHYQFMLYKEDITQLGIGCVFNVYDAQKGFHCINPDHSEDYRRKCPYFDMTSRQQRDMQARAQFVLGKF